MQASRKITLAAGIAASVLLVTNELRRAEAHPAAPQAGKAQASAATQPARSSAAIRYVTAPTGNAARYRVREQLVGLDLPNDAVGETNLVTGFIAADAKGAIIPSESKFTVEVGSLDSDRDMRDNYIRRRTLLTEQYPTVVLVPKAAKGISLPLPASGSRTFELIGDLTVRDVTKPTLWRVTAEFQGDRVRGSASTAFSFEDFNIEKPRVRSVLSVADTVKLELDFELVRER